MDLKLKGRGLFVALFVALLVLCAPIMANAGTVITDPANLVDGVNILRSSASGQTFNIGEGQALMVSSPADGSPITFDNCAFNLSGGTVKLSGDQDGISYNNGETVTKLFVSGDVTFNNCTFVTAEGAGKTTAAGYDAAIYFFGGNINLNGCALTANGYNGQFLGLYGSTGAVTFSDCDISTVNNRNGWSYAMYAGSVLKLTNGSTMTAAGSSTESGNANAFYSGDNRTGYDAIFVEDSTIDFSDNAAGGFAINNVNIHVRNSSITVNDNKGNACNSGMWYLSDNSVLTMRGNRGGHALSCIGIVAEDSTIDIQHNGYAGLYLQSTDSSFANCTVDIACNGEKLLSYSAGDVWLQGHTLTVTDCTSVTQPGSAWLGGVGRAGAVVTPSGTVVAHDLSDHSVDNLKSNCSPVLSNANVALAGAESEHTLFLNPFMESDYARGNAESGLSNNDADLFVDDNATNRGDVIGADSAKIGTLTDAELAHHRYDWANGEITDKATPDAYGVMRYACVQACDDYVGRTGEHEHSFDCAGTYVYAPLVGITFDDNVDDDSVTGMPEAQSEISYEGTVAEPTAPVRVSDDPVRQWVFTGWYTDPECTKAYDFSAPLTDNWTVVYAGWEQRDAPTATIVVTKVLNGADLSDDQFTFQLRDEAGTVIDEVKNDADGTVMFDPIVFGVEGTCEFTVSEVNDGQANVSYDPSVITIFVTVEHAENGALVARVSSDEELTFTNTYTSRQTTPLPQPKPSGDSVSSIPKTDDVLPSTGAISVAAVAGVAAAVAGALILSRKSR